MLENQVVIFSIANERYGVPVDQVQSIERLTPIAKVPKTLSFIKGVMNLRGVVTPVIDLRERFGFPQAASTEETRIIVVTVDAYTVGLIVDQVLDVAFVSDEAIQPPPNMVGGLQAEYLNGVANLDDHLLILVNLTKVLSDAENRQLREAEKAVKG